MAERAPRTIKAVRTRSLNVLRQSLTNSETLTIDVNVTVAALKRQKDALERNWAKFETAVDDYDGMNSEDEDVAVRTVANDDYAQQAARFDTVIGDLETAIETKSNAVKEIVLNTRAS